MNTLYKIIIFTSPVFAIILYFFLQMHARFQAEYSLENWRFEKQFHQVWNSNDTGIKEDKFLKIQEKEVEELWKEGQHAHNKTSVAKKKFEKALEDFDKGELEFSEEDIRELEKLKKELGEENE